MSNEKHHTPDLRVADVNAQPFRHGSLFSGIGGFDLAAEWMGWENVFHCELNEFGKRDLNHYWPYSKSYDDIKRTDFTIHRGSIDILTGGFPCQPYSQAGKRLGKEDERHLWPEMLRAIREISPRWIVGENVRGIITWNGGMVFDEVQADLETEVTKYSRFYFQLQALTLHTNDIEYGSLLSTPSSNDLNDLAKNKMLPTPMASDCGEKVTGLETQNSLLRISYMLSAKKYNDV